MNISNNTILITGGSAGIGFEFAKALSADNRIIITGRNEARLKAAVAQLPNTSYILGDVSDADDVDHLVETINSLHKDLNIVINNAGKSASPYDLSAEGVDAY